MFSDCNDDVAMSNHDDDDREEGIGKERVILGKGSFKYHVTLFGHNICKKNLK